MGRIDRRLPMLAACAGLVVSIAARGAGTLAIRVEEDGAPVPCRIYVEAADGSFPAPPGAVALRKEQDPHFCALGPVEVAVPAGKTRVRADRGPEYEPAEGEVVVPDGGRAAIVLRLRRWVRMRDEGWTCGDLHVHRGIDGMHAIILAEDLNIGTNITVWNKNNAWRTAPPPAEPIVRVDRDHAFSILDAEVERFPACGAVVFLGLRKPLSMDAGPRFPSDADFCRKAREAGAFIDQEKPIWNTAPILAALGLIDSIGIVHNHFHPRDVLTWNPSGIGWDAKYSTTKGFALGTCDLYYRARA
ncbi:MAG: hypothetical protein JXP34_06515 [Planctomycetes bacterium]|nr:hypothetical protein [Planctomycetota bacterium]